LSPELPTFTADLAAKQNLTFPILNDHGLAISKSFGLVFTLPDDLKNVYLSAFKNDLEKRNGDPSWQLPIPARFVIDRTGIVRYAEADPD
jgi:peroxiredoxin